MKIDQMDEQSWERVLGDLREHRIPLDSVHEAIVKLGKPYDARRIQAAKDVVSMYLTEDDPWVRHEALWFLTSWGRLLEFQPEVIEMMLHDISEDNRGFAANCLGVLRAGSCDLAVLRVLRSVALNEREVEQVRVKAYASMVKVSGRPVRSTDLFDFEIGDKHLSDVDWNWVRSGQNEFSE